MDKFKRLMQKVTEGLLISYHYDDSSRLEGSLKLEAYADGRVLRKGEETNVDAENVKVAYDRIVEEGFFDGKCVHGEGLKSGWLDMLTVVHLERKLPLTVFRINDLGGDKAIEYDCMVQGVLERLGVSEEELDRVWGIERVNALQKTLDGGFKDVKDSR